MLKSLFALTIVTIATMFATSAKAEPVTYRCVYRLADGVTYYSEPINGDIPDTEEARTDFYLRSQAAITNYATPKSSSVSSVGCSYDGRYDDLNSKSWARPDAALAEVVGAVLNATTSRLAAVSKANAREMYVACYLVQDGGVVRSDILAYPDDGSYQERRSLVTKIFAAVRGLGEQSNCAFNNDRSLVLNQQVGMSRLSNYSEDPSLTKVMVSAIKPEPDPASAPVQAATRLAVLEFLSARQQRTDGYTAASIGLRYRFLLCADEVQVAYGLDRKSLNVSPTYETRDGESLRSVPAPGSPVAPTTIDLDAVVTLGDTDTIIAQFKDAIAGESLGFDCFSGQTKKLGTVSALFRANAPRKEVLSWLERLQLRQLFNRLPTVLRHAGMLDTSPKQAADRAVAVAEREQEEKDAQVRASQENMAREQAEMLARHKAVAAENIANRQAFLKAQAEHEQTMRDYEAAKLRQEAATSAARAAYQAKLQRWQACTGGDRSQCEQQPN